MLAFTARYFSGLPFQPAVTVMLREFLPGAKHVACNELQVSPCLCWALCARVTVRVLPGAKHVACNELQARSCLCSGLCGRVQVLLLLECHQGASSSQSCVLCARQQACATLETGAGLVHSICVEQLRERFKQ